MSYRRVSRIALVVLTVALVACSGDNTTPTQPGLGGLASLSGEGGNGGGRGGGGGGGGGGGEQTLYTDFTLSGGYTTAGPLDVANQELQKGILLVQGQGFDSGPIGTNFDYDAGSCLVTVGNKDVTDTPAGDSWEDQLLPYLNRGPLNRSWGMKVNLDLLGRPDFSTKFDASQMGTGFFGEGELITNTGILPHAAFGPVTVTIDATDPNVDVFTFSGGRVMVTDRNSKKRVVILCQHSGDITVTLTLASPRS